MAKQVDQRKRDDERDTAAHIFSSRPNKIPSAPKFFVTLNLSVSEDLKASFEGGTVEFFRKDEEKSDYREDKTVTVSQISDFGGGAMTLECTFDQTRPGTSFAIKITKGGRVITTTEDFKLTVG